MPVQIDASMACPQCGQTMRAEKVKTAIWRDERLFVVEDVPACVCDSCMEQYYDDWVTEALRRLTENGFSTAKVKREIVVPVFSLEEQQYLPPRKELPDDVLPPIYG
jgi:YgiT-type zinc finger domain-containing protein